MISRVLGKMKECEEVLVMELCLGEAGLVGKSGVSVSCDAGDAMKARRVLSTSAAPLEPAPLPPTSLRSCRLQRFEVHVSWSVARPGFSFLRDARVVSTILVDPSLPRSNACVVHNMHCSISALCITLGR